MATVIIHCNFRMPHQVAWADHLQAGFSALEISSVITADRNLNGDLHVVMGPHYAMREWLGKPNVLKLDRPFYGSVDEWATLGWLGHDEFIDYRNADSPPDRFESHSDAEITESRDWRTDGGMRVLFGDYGGDLGHYREVLETCDAFRPHPDSLTWPACPVPLAKGPLSDVLDRTGLAVGGRTTALITALLRGIPVACFDYRNPAWHLSAWPDGFYGARDQWEDNLAYTQWHVEELRSGLFYRHLE